MGEKMRKTALVLAASFSTLLAADAALAFGGMIAVGMNEAAQVGAVETPFRAEASLETEEQNINTVIYYKPGHIRDEMKMGGQDMVVLQDLEAQKTYMLMPQGMYMEMDMGQSNDQMKEYRLIEREVVGREKVNGFDTTKYKVIYEGPDGKYGGFSWFTDDNIAVRAFMVSEEDGEKQRVQFQIKELERSPQQMSLFQVPSDYRKLDIGGFDLSSMMPGAAGQALELLDL